MKHFKSTVIYSLLGWCLACSNAMAADDAVCDAVSQSEIQKVYIAYYGRPGDPPGVEYWCGRFVEESNLDSIIEAFGATPEFNASYGGLSNDQLIDTIFLQMFGRDPDEAGKSFYSNKLSSGESSLQTITLEILNGASGSDKRVIDERVDAANLFTNGIPAGFEISADNDVWNDVLEKSTALILQIVANAFTGVVDADTVAYISAQIGNLTRDENANDELDYAELDADFDADGIKNSEDAYLFSDANAPLFMSQLAVRVDVVEGRTEVAYLPALQDARVAPTFSLATGDDSSLFAINASSGIVRFIDAPDYEVPRSKNGNNAYKVTVTATDTSDNTKKASQTVNISVTNVDESAVPVFVSASSISMPEEQLATGYVAKANAELSNSNIDFVIYYLPEGVQDNDFFEIDIQSGELNFQSAPDFESGSHDPVYRVTIAALTFDSRGFPNEERLDVAITVENQDITFDEPSDPVDRSLLGFEGVVYSAVARADTGFAVDQISFRLVAGSGGLGNEGLSVFNLTAAGNLSFKTTPPPLSNSGAENIYAAYIEVLADGVGTGIIQVVNIKVDLNKIKNNASPVFDSPTTANAVYNSLETGYTAHATDADGNTLIYSLTRDEDIEIYTIDSATGVLSFKEPQTIARGSRQYTVEVTVSDGVPEHDTVQRATITLQAPVGFTIADAHVVEGDTEDTYLAFRVKLQETYSYDVILEIETLDSDGTATVDTDYEAISDVLTIPQGDSLGFFAVLVYGDTVDGAGSGDIDETVIVSAKDSLAGGAQEPVTATGVIYDKAKLNDTGITLCGDYAFDGGSEQSDNDVTCGSSDDDGDNVPSGQDAIYGRDVSHKDDGDGVAGFSFTKLDASGQVLPFDAEEWSCVQDNTTGLMWEVKSPSGSESLRDADFKYTWYNTTGTNDGGYEGARTGAICFDILHCTTESYPETVNDTNLCGASDWRTPTRGELAGLVNFSRVNPSIDADWFPNTKPGKYWSSSPVSGLSELAWRTSFSIGSEEADDKGGKNYIRLVRDVK